MPLIKIEATEMIINRLVTFYASLTQQWEDALIAATIQVLDVKGKNGKPPESEIVLYYAPIVRTRGGTPDIVVYGEAAGLDKMLGSMRLDQITQKKELWTKAWGIANTLFRAELLTYFQVEWQIVARPRFVVAGWEVS